MLVYQVRTIARKRRNPLTGTELFEHLPQYQQVVAAEKPVPSQEPVGATA